jgi:copper chaperone CopZ
MKPFILSMFAVCIFAFNGSAQVKRVETAKIKTPTVQCEMCKSRIETYLKRYDGVTFINVNYKKKETTVKYLTDRINIEEIKTAIANAGYDADDVPANTDSYNRLPKCCKKPEDGGGMKKQ